MRSRDLNKELKNVESVEQIKELLLRVGSRKIRSHLTGEIIEEINIFEDEKIQYKYLNSVGICKLKTLYSYIYID